MVRFTHALLLVDGRYVLQLRDDKPGIASPGMWALFGGRVEEGEEPHGALLREIEEELCLRLQDCRMFWSLEYYSPFVGAVALYSFFEADITDFWGQHRLTEGQAVERFAYEDIPPLRMSPIMRQALERHHNGFSG